ncbi:MAG: SDR family NAD(P)-dependent oxidoreductase [Pseudomonadota bacterium]
MTDKRLILITGASRGIGRAAALALAGPDTHLILLARSQKALEKLDDECRDNDGETSLVPVDLKDLDALDRLGAALHEQFGRIDALIANAAILGTIGPLQMIGKRSFEETMTTNVTAQWRLLRSMDPLLRQSDSPRAVFLTSSVASTPRPFWGPYQASKAALEALAQAWAQENEVLPLRVNIFDPGGTATDMRADAMPGEDPSTLPTPDDVAAELVKLVDVGETRTGVVVRYRELVG